MLVSVELRGHEAPGLDFKRRGEVIAIMNKIHGRPVSITVTDDSPIKDSPIITKVLESVDEKIRGALTVFRVRYNNNPLDLAKTFVDYKIGQGAILVVDALVQ